MPTDSQINALLKKINFYPTDGQDKVLHCPNREILVVGGERAGKAVSIDTLIPSPSGWLTMEQVQPGDWVYDSAGCPVEVEWVSPIYTNHKCYELTFDDGTKVVADAEHLWAVQSEKERKNSRRKKIGGKETKVTPSDSLTERKHSVLTTEELSREVSLPKPKTKWGCKQTSNYSMPCCLPVGYDEYDLLIHPYVLGAWLGDGHSAGATITDGEPDSWIVRQVESHGFTIRKQASKYSWGILGLLPMLRAENLLGNKHIPKVYKEASVYQRIALVQGLMDTDGSVSHSGNEFYNKNEQLIDDFREVLASLGIKSFKRQKEAKLYGKSCGTTYTVTFSTDLPVFTLPRKRAKQNLNPSGHTQEHYIRQIIPCESVPVKCIKVRSEDGLFLITKSFITTHNSKVSATFLTTRLLFGKLFWLVAADYNRTRAEFDYICDYLDTLGLAYFASKQVDPGVIEIQGGIKIETKSAQDPRKIAMVAPDGILVCEASQIDYETYLRLRGRIAEKRGWLMMSGTFESSLGWYPELYARGQAAHSTDDLISFSLPSWSNTHIYPLGENDPEIIRLKNDTPHDYFMERYGGVPCPPKGRVFEEFSNKLHTGPYLFDPDDPVYLFVDPGYSSAYAVLAAQKHNDTLYIFDEIYERGFTTSEIIKMCMQRQWWNNVVGGAIDVAATQHQALPAVAEIWANEAGIHLTSQKVQISDGIEAIKRFLIINPLTNDSLLRINSNCRGLISEFGGCPSPIDGQTRVYTWKHDREGNIVGATPDDKNNHAIKALAYGLISLFGYTQRKKKRRVTFY